MSTKRRKRKKKEFYREARERKAAIPVANIKVVGVGGGGGNAISRMSRGFSRGVEFIAINTDHQDLDHCAVRRKIYLGRNLTRGLGTGMNPELGRQAAEENRSEIAESLRGADIVFIASGFGGGTGTGASPVVAEVAKQAGALTLAFVTKPFAFEGSQRLRIAEEGVSRIRDKVDALVVIPNDRIFSIIHKDTPIMKAFEAIDEVMKNALQGIVDIIVTPGIINVDFADVRSVIQDSGTAVVGIGVAAGQDRAVQAVNQAMNSPLLEMSPEGAHGVLLGIAGGRDMRMTEINEAAKLVSQAADPAAKIIFGAYYDRNLKPNQIKVILIATGLGAFSPVNSLFGNYSRSASSLAIEEKSKSLSKGKGVAVGSETKTESPADSSSAATPAAEGSRERKKKTDSDIWDIPTFLRRKRK